MQGVGLDAGLTRGRHLVVHEGDQGRDHQDQALPMAAGNW